MLVSFLTPSIPERAPMLRDCVESVARMGPVPGWDVEHLWWIDQKYEGCSKTMNRLARMAKGDWLVPLADDDLVLPWFLREHVVKADGADVVYAPPLVTEEPGKQFCGMPPNIPAVALIRADLWRKVDGYNEKIGQTEDMAFFAAALSVNAHFERVARHSWVYRFHGANKSRGYIPNGEAA